MDKELKMVNNRRKINNNRRKRNLRKRRIKKLRFVMFIMFILALGYITYGTGKVVLTSASNNKELESVEDTSQTQQEVKQIDAESLIPEEVRNSTDPIVQGLLEKSKNNPDVVKILSNISVYPRELLELAEKKDEAIEFVSNYINYDETKYKEISIKKEYKKGEIPLFMQWDERWGYDKYGSEFIAINGCGPTALAMVAVGLTGDTDINPKVIAKFSEENGYLVDGIGSKWDLMTEGAKNFGVMGEELPLNREIIIDTLKSGQPIIASMGPGTFTSSGHFIVLTGVDKNNKIIVNDSDSKIRSKQTWNIDVFMNEAENLWSFMPI